MSDWTCRNENFVDNHEAVVDSLLSQRNKLEDVEYQQAKLESLSQDFLNSSDFLKASSILAEAKGKDFAIIGDYDADGIVSTALLKKTISILGGRCATFLPSRWIHGYGLGEKMLFDFLKRYKWRKPHVLFIVDCGSSSEPQVKQLKENGIENIVVIDHHIVSEATKTVSADAHINWRLLENSEKTKELCASGQVFHLCKHVFETKNMDWKWMLSLAAVATVADAVKIEGDNRVIVKNGISYSNLSSNNLVGLKKLIDVKCKGVASQKNVAFYAAPMLNASGRMKSPDISLDLLLEEGSNAVGLVLGEMDILNNDRKKTQDDIFKEGIEMLESDDSFNNGIFLYKQEWNIGVIGISCSQMVEKYGVPTMMFGSYGGKIKGSGRSVEGVDIKAVLDACGSEVFETWGGHEMACGAVVRDGMFEEAKKRFQLHLNQISGGKKFAPALYYDMGIHPKDVTIETGDSIFNKVYPYCVSTNPEPVFKMEQVIVKSVLVNKYKIWCRMELSVEGVGLNMFMFYKEKDKYDNISEGDVVDIYFSFPQFSSLDVLPEDYLLEVQDLKLVELF